MTYVTRCLSAVGKRPEAPNSHAALVAEWTLTLAQAKRGGNELAADCVESVNKLMDGVWASAESVGVASLRGTHYVSSLFDGSIPDVSAFRSFHEGLGTMRNMLKRYKRSFRASGGGGGGVTSLRTRSWLQSGGVLHDGRLDLHHRIWRQVVPHQQLQRVC